MRKQSVVLIAVAAVAAFRIWVSRRAAGFSAVDPHEGIADDLMSAGYGEISVDPIETDLQSLLVLGELYVARYCGYIVTKPLFLFLNLAALAVERFKTRHRYRVIPLTLGATARKPV
jgi:hypothetical protein